MKNVYTILLSFLLILPLNAQDTFSIVAVDEETGEIGGAGATCVDGIAAFGGIKILNEIIPGRGGVNAQAWICINPHINLDNAIEQMANGLNPDEIISWLTENDACAAQGNNPEYRQYGIADFDENGMARTAAFTGDQADDYKGHILGPNYAIQGNILLGPEVLEGMENGFTETEGTLAEKLMAAMQGANIPGADSRCLSRGTSSTSAFLKVVKPDDDPENPYLLLDVLEMPFGEEPIDSLQTLFDAWLATSADEVLAIASVISIFPNPSDSKIMVDIKQSTIQYLEIRNSLGQLLSMQKVDGLNRKSLDISFLERGVYYLIAKDQEGKQYSTRFVKT